MENGNADSDEPELVTLVLGNERFVADRKKLADNSHYFSALFSENFKDHMQDEFKINFDITPQTLKVSAIQHYFHPVFCVFFCTFSLLSMKLSALKIYFQILKWRSKGEFGDRKTNEPFRLLFSRS